MRKAIIIASLSLVVIVFVAISLIRSDSGFKSIYFVPGDAFIIAESQDPLKAWSTIVESDIWAYYQSNPYFKQLNTDIQAYDSLVKSNKLLWKIMGEKAITISIHPLKNNNYDLLYIADIGKIAKSKNPEKFVKSILGKSYEVTSRKYEHAKIIEVFDKVEQDNYFIAFSQGKLLFSFEPGLVEKSIEASLTKEIGLDMKYLDVNSKVKHKGLFELYINYKQVASFVEALSPDAATTFKHNIRYMQYSGLIFNVDANNYITIEGFTSLNDTTPNDYLGMINEGDNTLESGKVIPKRIASMLKVHFDDAETFFQSSVKSISDENFQEYEKAIIDIEKKLKIDVSENLFDWMDKEIVMLQTQPSNLGRNNEFALILQASDSAKAAENLSFLWKQIKKNTPIKIKSIRYKNYSIDYVAFPGIVKALFGNALEKIEKPYITQIDNYVIFSNHPQTLKNIIDDYLSTNTLEASAEYYNFAKQFGKKSSAEFYAEPPVLFQNVKAFVDTKTWQDLAKNKKYISCFNQAGVHFNRTDDLIHFTMKALFSPEKEQWKRPYYDPNEIYSMFNAVEKLSSKPIADTLPKIIITNLDSKKHEEFFDDGTLKLEVKLKDGQKNGNLRIYHANGELKLKGEYENDKPVGKWKYYDEEGENIKVDVYD